MDDANTGLPDGAQEEPSNTTPEEPSNSTSQIPSNGGMQELPEARKWRISQAFVKLLDPNVLQQVYAAFPSDPNDLQGRAYVLGMVGLTPDDETDLIAYLQSVGPAAFGPLGFWR